MEQWRVKAVTASLLDVPGIGPAAVKKLAEGDKDDRVSNTYQLFGKVRHSLLRTNNCRNVCLIHSTVCIHIKHCTIAVPHVEGTR